MAHSKGCHCDQTVAGFAPTTRRQWLAGAAGLAMTPMIPRFAQAAAAPIDLAQVATPKGSGLSGISAIETLFRPEVPRSSDDLESGMWNVWDNYGPQSVELEWPVPIRTDRVSVYWGEHQEKIAVPADARLSYWDGDGFVPVERRGAIGFTPDEFNTYAFEPVTTDRLRLEMIPQEHRSVGLMRLRVMAAGDAPALAPAVMAGIDRSVVVGGRTYLDARAGWVDRGPEDELRWQKESGPGEVTFADAGAAETTARFSEPGDYVLRLTAKGKGGETSSSLTVRAVAAPPAERLDVVYTTPYAIDNPLWNDRVKTLIVDWIPHVVAHCERDDVEVGRGGIDNFREAAKALRGEPHEPHKGREFSNAWVHQSIESMCLALMVDPQGDAEIEAAQARMRETLDRWIPIVLSAQEPDGYLQTAYTLADREDWPERWIPEQRTGHEGYVGGYFIEAAINHYTLTGGEDRRLYDGAKRLADCWVANIGPEAGKKTWYDGHQEMEQALVRFGRFINDVEGGGAGDAYVRLAQFLIDSREGGMRYDQSHLPAVKQYEAVGHAVRAMYFYSGMADIAAETGDVDYQSAVASLWDNMVNRKYYVTGGVGSGTTAEGFGPDYDLPYDAYCESCSSCGLVFFQYKMNLAYHDARYADLYEETMYNALMGAVSMDGKSFCYTNPLVDTERSTWHVVPCCVGNIPRTLLMVPTWAYAKGSDALFVNLFIGSRIDVGEVGGTRVEMVQETDYPWSGDVALTVNPEEEAEFALHVRVPDRDTSALYRAEPRASGIEGLTVNGEPAEVRIDKGYAVIRRKWTPGDRVAFSLPMPVQRVDAMDEVQASRGQAALRYGPLVYSAETADGQDITQPLGKAAPTTTWDPDLLHGIVALDGEWQDGSPMRAVPYYARMNRTGEPVPPYPATYEPGNEEQMAHDESTWKSRVWVEV